MVTFTVGEQQIEYERLARTRSDTVYEAVLVVESRTGEPTVRRIELDAASRDDLTSDDIEAALGDWQSDHPSLTIEHLIVRETSRCGFGTRVGGASDDVPSRPDGSSDGRSAERDDESVLYRGGATTGQSTIGFADVDVREGDEVEFHVGGQATSVYGTETGVVTGIKSGTAEYNVLLVETDSGTKRVRDDWLVDDADPADDAADDESGGSGESTGGAATGDEDGDGASDGENGADEDAAGG